MKERFVRLIYVTALCVFFAAAASAQQQEFHQLSADDFKGIPRSDQFTVAYTNCSINFHYQARREKNYYLLDFNIGLTLNNYKSWLDRSRVTSPAVLAEVLKHEQGHYNIAYMEQQELLRALRKNVFYSDYQTVAQAIFDRIDAKYKQLNLDYDADTQHMQNRTQQQSWDAYFKKKLTYMPQE